MNSTSISLPLAFIAGLLSFASPCVLPLVPAYLGHLSGVTLNPTRRHAGGRTALHALLFVLGFGLVFVGLWTSLGLLGAVVPRLLPLLRQIGGALLIVMGLQVMGVLRLPLLYREKRMAFRPIGPPSLSSSFLVGVIFAAGWTPCIGPVLSGIIGLATLSGTIGQGALLLAVYAAGLGVPFILAALSLDRLAGVTQRLRAHARTVEVVTGSLLIGVGVLMLTNLFIKLPGYFAWGGL